MKTSWWALTGAAAVAVFGWLTFGRPGAGRGQPTVVQARALAAWFLQVPEAALEKLPEHEGKRPATIKLPGTTTWWRLRGDYTPPVGAPRPRTARVFVRDKHWFSVSAFWTVAQRAEATGRPISEARAKAIAESFLRQRRIDDVRPTRCYQRGADRGRVTLYGVTFESQTPTGNIAADVTVDALRGAVVSATYGVHEGPPPVKPPRVTMAQARQMVLRALEHRGEKDLHVAYERFSTAMPGFPRGRPMYHFALVGKRPYRGALVHAEEHWYVDGWDLRVGTLDAFPEAKRWFEQEAERFQQRARELTKGQKP